MMALRGVLCVVLLAAVSASILPEGFVRYDNYSLIRVTPTNDGQVRLLNGSIRKMKGVDLWTTPHIGSPVDIFLSPKVKDRVLHMMKLTPMKLEKLIDNIQPYVEQQYQVDTRAAKAINWTEFYSLETINAWLVDQAKQYPNIATVITAGKSTQGRTLTGLKIAHKPGLPIVFVEAGIHAREWISPATATWFIQQALNSTNELVKSYEWHVFPSVNPDGYVYTQTDRMWRKNRATNQGSSCIGVDTNRNWPYQWNAENNACSETYPGKSPASEPETQGLMNYLKPLAARTRVYISLHSYSQLLMYPWGYTSQPPKDNQRFNQIATKAVSKLRTRYGTNYKYGPIATTIYKAYGSTIDYAYSLNISYPFVFELRDTGRYGFLMPKQEIMPTVLETFDAMEVILAEAKN